MAGHTRYYLRAGVTDAEAVDDARGFTVLAGAVGRGNTKQMVSGYRTLRDRLLKEGILVPTGEDRVRLTRTYRFESPSAAASVLTGSSRNGRLDWKDAAGRTLRENQERSAR